jgi:Uma2 family endonuclease
MELETVAIQTTISGEIIARDVTYEEFLQRFDGEFVEWVNGLVIKMASIDRKHDALSGFFRILLSAYLDLSGGGQVLQDPMVMRPRPDLPGRVPDIQVLLPTSLHFVLDNQVAGPADLVVEIISPGSERRDCFEKFSEYERGSIKEYWVLDHRYQEAIFYQLDENGQYQRIQPDENGVYHSKVLPKLKLSVALLWRDPLPGFWEIAQMVQTMFAQE